MNELVREVLDNVKPDELHRPSGLRRFKAWFSDWKARANAAVPADAQPFHFEGVPKAYPDAGGCPACEEGERRQEAARCDAGDADA